MTQRSVTELLLDWRSGEEEALEELMPKIYGELRKLAQWQLRGERSDHTLQATELVNEACMRLLQADVSWQNKAHFIAVASNQMRRLLVDHARHKKRVRRDPGIRVTLSEDVALQEPAYDLLDLDEALRHLSEIDPRKASMVELRYFGGLGQKEIAEALSVSESTVKRDLRFARSWLFQRLSPDS